MAFIERSAVKIRPLTASDVGWVSSVYWAKIPEKEMVTAQRGGRNDVSFIAEFEGKLVGFILAQITYAGMPMSGAAVIHLIAVQPEYQHRGIGTMLVNELQSLCKERGIPVMRALIPDDDLETTRYFREVGFLPSKSINFEKPC